MQSLKYKTPIPRREVNVSVVHNATEIDQIVVMGVATPHRLFKIIVASWAIGTVIAVCGSLHTCTECLNIALKWLTFF